VSGVACGLLLFAGQRELLASAVLLTESLLEMHRSSSAFGTVPELLYVYMYIYMENEVIMRRIYNKIILCFILYFARIFLQKIIAQKTNLKRTLHDLCIVPYIVAINSNHVNHSTVVVLKLL